MRRTVIKATLIPAIVIAMIAYACLPGCGPGARTKALQASLVALNAADDTKFAVYKERAAQIIEHATSKEEGRAQLEAWRATVDEITAAIDVGYRAIYTAAIINDEASAKKAAEAVAKALALVKEKLKP